MEAFFTKIGLKSLWEKFPVDFTHVHTDLKSTSTIDHFLVNERLLDFIVDAGALHLGDNLSRHSPIMLKLNIGNISVKREQTQDKAKRKPAWYKATANDILEYTETLHDKLINLPMPPSLCCSSVHCEYPGHRAERDSHCIDVLCSMIESSQRAIPLSSRRTRVINNGDKIGGNIPGWSHFVKIRCFGTVFG